VVEIELLPGTSSSHLSVPQSPSKRSRFCFSGRKVVLCQLFRPVSSNTCQTERVEYENDENNNNKKQRLLRR
jgi:hypothetical protein